MSCPMGVCQNLCKFCHFCSLILLVNCKLFRHNKAKPPQSRLKPGELHTNTPNRSATKGFNMKPISVESGRLTNFADLCTLGNKGRAACATRKRKGGCFRFCRINDGCDEACFGFHIEYCLILVFVYSLETVVPLDWGGKVAGVGWI